MGVYLTLLICACMGLEVSQSELHVDCMVDDQYIPGHRRRTHVPGLICTVAHMMISVASDISGARPRVFEGSGDGRGGNGGGGAERQEKKMPEFCSPLIAPKAADGTDVSIVDQITETYSRRETLDSLWGAEHGDNHFEWGGLRSLESEEITVKDGVGEPLLELPLGEIPIGRIARIAVHSTDGSRSEPFLARAMDDQFDGSDRFIGVQYDPDTRVLKLDRSVLSNGTYKIHLTYLPKVEEGIEDQPYLQIEPGGKYLDIGCGTCRLINTFQVAHPEAEFIGLDINEGLFEGANQDLDARLGMLSTEDQVTIGDQRPQLMQANAFALKFWENPEGIERESLDGVFISMRTVNFCQTTNNLAALAKAIRPYLKMGARVVFDVPAPPGPHENVLYKMLMKRTDRLLEKYDGLHDHLKSRLEKYNEDHGYKDPDVTHDLRALIYDRIDGVDGVDLGQMRGLFSNQGIVLAFHEDRGWKKIDVDTTTTDLSQDDFKVFCIENSMGPKSHRPYLLACLNGGYHMSGEEPAEELCATILRTYTHFFDRARALKIQPEDAKAFVDGEFFGVDDEQFAALRDNVNDKRAFNGRVFVFEKTDIPVHE